MRNALGVGRIFGISIKIHFSWLIVLALVIGSLALGYYPQQFPDWSATTYWVAATVSSLLLFASVLVHELAHSVVALRRGMPVEGITLFIFGGVSNIGEDARRPADEFLMSIVGPLASFGIAGGSVGLLVATRALNEPLSAVLVYLAVVNVLLGLFNLIPGFPLDGGRVLRAVVWAILQNQRRATRVATFVGQGIAYLFIFGGLFVAFGGTFVGFQADILSGIWLVFIGWFLAGAASAAGHQAAADEQLRLRTVSELMTPQPLTVRPELTVQTLVSDFIMRHNLRAVPVVENDQLVGIVTLSNIHDVPIERWGTTRVGDVMGGREGLRTIGPDDSLGDAMQSLDDANLGQLPVVREGRLVGLLSRHSLTSYLQRPEEAEDRAA